MKPALTAAALSLAALLTAFTGPAAAQWKWRTPDGRVQYSDRPPPPGVAEKDILQQPRGAARPATTPSPAASPAAASPAAAASDPELEARRRKEKEQQDAQRKAEEDKLAKQRAENCQRAQGYLRSLNDGIRIARTNAQGEREILNDEQRAEETRRTQQIIASDCR
ncbi:MAG: DUF4124 domain-containing protein [Pseudomonadota bacterium]